MDGLFVVVVVINLALCAMIASIAVDKGRSGTAWFLIGFFFSAVVALLLLLVAGETQEAKSMAAAKEAIRRREADEILDTGFRGTPEELARLVDQRTKPPPVVEVARKDLPPLSPQEIKSANRKGYLLTFAFLVLTVIVVFALT